MPKPITRPVRRPELPPTPAPAVAVDTVSSATPDVVRLAVTLTPDQSAIDWSRMRESTREKFIKLALRDPKLQAGHEGANAPALEIFSEQWCAIVYDAFGQLEATLIQRIYKVTAEQAAVMLYSDDEKRLLTKPTQRILNKYAGSWLASYTDEAALIIALGTVHVSHLQALRASIEQAQRPQPVALPMTLAREKDGDE